ncbi:MAG: leucine--tRNA ligase [Candidatus Altiarchaeota archaeon]|nr:leucine--tRNA ligase [Candidatus Altiarchaeota archaeon]
MAYEFKKIEEKWRGGWDKTKLFESDPDKRPKFYINVAYPYPSGGMHVGHARTYTVPDIFARYKRMLGYNVLFPMAWHVTGTPIIGAVNRMKEGEEKQLRVLKRVYGVTDEDMKGMQTPMEFARYFIENHYIASMHGLGYSIDWRRQFTTNDPHYNRFITWQYTRLHDMGLVTEGKHPVKYCIKEKNPVTAHDLLEGEESEIQEWTLLKFKFGDAYIVAATLRPETVFGQTNMWVNPDVTYVKVRVGGEIWIISKECARKLPYQDKKAEIVGEIKGGDMIGKYCTAPGLNNDIIILPSSFPDPNVATGLVTSVPSDAPYDWVALRDLQQNKAECERYGLDFDKIKSIQVIPIIRTKKFGDNAALRIVEQMGITGQKETKKLDEATKEIYKEGFHTGVMNENCAQYAGMPVERAKEQVKADLIEQGLADTMHEFSEPVRCRCGGEVVVANVDSWFLDYGNDEWKAKATGCIEQMKFIPENSKTEYIHTVNWLKSWPCVRNFGLGTRLPFDDRFMIEPLSDSTIYMSFYTISHLIKKYKPEQLKPEFFDFVYKNIGSLDKVSKATSIPSNELDEIKKSFDYWYPFDWRCSASELIGNHLTFCILHHVALFPADRWPKGMVAFGVGLLEGAKMSSSKGNVVLLRTAIEKFGADVVRLFLMSNAEPWQDFDWREAEVIGVQKSLGKFWHFSQKVIEDDSCADLRRIDFWLLSKKERMKAAAIVSLEAYQTRKALQAAFFEVFNYLRWYERRGGSNAKVLKDFLDEWVRVLAPFIPYMAEEIWEKLGKKGFIAEAGYPKVDEGKMNDKAEAAEKILQNLIEDVAKIVDVTKKKPKECYLYVAPSWKFELYEKIAAGAQIGDVMKDEKFRKYGKEVPNIFKKSKETEFLKGWSQKDEEEILKDAQKFLEKELGCGVKINDSDDPANRARFAMPMKPAIYLI